MEDSVIKSGTVSSEIFGISWLSSKDKLDVRIKLLENVGGMA